MIIFEGFCFNFLGDYLVPRTLRALVVGRLAASPHGRHPAGSGLRGRPVASRSPAQGRPVRSGGETSPPSPAGSPIASSSMAVAVTVAPPVTSAPSYAKATVAVAVPMSPVAVPSVPGHP